MQKIAKFVGIILVAGATVWALKGWFAYNFSGGAFMASNVLVQAVQIALAVVIATVGFMAIRGIIKFDLKRVNDNLFSVAIPLVLALSIAASGCNRAQANVQTLVTNDCGQTWQIIKVGETVPRTIGYCSYTITIPDYPMQGEVKFKTSFSNRVLANVEVSYEYVIIDGVKFISEAKYIGKMNSESDDKTNASSAYESAENSVIDKRIREAASTSLIQQDIVDFSQAEFEDLLLNKANEMLAEKGVKLSFISFVPIPEEQTRLAIDVLTAQKVYESKGLGDLGQKIIVAKSGSAKVIVTTETPAAPVVKEE